MRYFIVILLYVIIAPTAMGQSDSTSSYLGTLLIEGHGLLTYKIEYKLLDNSKIAGISYTDLYGEDRTESKIEGVINIPEKKISFKEISNITTNATDDVETFCFIQVQNAKIDTVAGKAMINGTFNGRFPSGEQCASGKIVLMNEKVIDSLQVLKKEMKSDSAVAQLKKTEEIPILKKNDRLTSDWASNDIIIDLWDGNIEDGDVINIYYNDKLMKENLTIKKDIQTITIPFADNKCVLRIVAMNEGSIATNTVNFLLRDSVHTNPFISKLKKDQAVLVELTRK